MTPYHSQFWAHLLTLQGASGSIENLSRSISNARVDLNPHQVDAALFALRSPLSNGTILADEVGLGKTIEAGIILSQRWAERRRKVLLIVPATLRKQWQQELEEKLYLRTTVLDSRTFNDSQIAGNSNPLDVQDRIVIVSYQFAAAKAQEVALVPWDVVVIDEAHRLRNVYKAGAKTARKIADAVGQATKLLLTATPLQNSLMELYGLVSFVDDHIFGTPDSFRERFVKAGNENDRNVNLRQRLQSVCIRTLRKQVVEYIPFTKRIPITQDFHPSDDEHRLYESISTYLQRDTLIALPKSQRTLITLVLRKLLASSTFAIAATLRRLIYRLERLSDQLDLLTDDDLDGVDELKDELAEVDDGDDDASPDIDPEQVKLELEELRGFSTLADTITTNAKGQALIPALKIAFERTDILGAARKAVIFTESRRTQEYLFRLLSSNGHEGRLVMMNGSNSDPSSQQIYEQWLRRHEGQDVISGSRPVDIKGAIVEQFRDHADILIATEAAAEGVNLQFCSLVVNYDLPWNPQRVEQRIGRCHRYGQKHDVVVLNFINSRNEADRRVHELLSEKFSLFSGVFGVSDEVLGVIESGVDIERRIAQVYQTCRTSEEITAAFDKLQADLDDQIQTRMTATRQALLEHFDQDVSHRLRVNRDKTLETLNERERWLLDLTRTELDSQVVFEGDRPRFRYIGPDSQHGYYHFDWREAEKTGDTFYRQDHPLAIRLIHRAIDRQLPLTMLKLDYSGYGEVVSVLKPLVGRSGWLELSKLTIQALDKEEFLVLAACTDDGQPLDEEIARKLLRLPAHTAGPEAVPSVRDLTDLRTHEVRAKVKEVDQRNAKFFDEEVVKLDRWSDDLKQGLERDIKDIDKQIREARRLASLAASLREKLEGQKTIKVHESTRNRKRRELFEAQDGIDKRRDELIDSIEGRLLQRQVVKALFLFRWTVE